MFDHVGFLVRDAGVSLPFFSACLKPLGIERVQDMPQFDAAIFKAPSQRGFMFVAGAVGAVHAAALAHGGRDNGLPGFRNQGRVRNANYVAFVLDPDNNNIEASWPNPDAG